MKLTLPDVTLVMVETREHELARMAIWDCLRAAAFGDVLILTDDPQKIPMPITSQQYRYHIVPDWPDKLGWSRAWWYDVPPLVSTSHTLNIQWDSWIWDATMWTDAFLQFDYVGAPWWYTDGKNVGNGGFSLVSTRLKRYLRDHRGNYPCDTPLDDDLLCRKYRPKLEEAGFVWAPEAIAHKFAFECCRPSETSRHFGFHAMMNWPVVLNEESLMERLDVAVASPYIRKSYMMKAFCDKNPDLMKKFVGRSTGGEDDGETVPDNEALQAAE